LPRYTTFVDFFEKSCRYAVHGRTPSVAGFY